MEIVFVAIVQHVYAEVSVVRNPINLQNAKKVRIPKKVETDGVISRTGAVIGFAVIASCFLSGCGGSGATSHVTTPVADISSTPPVSAGKWVVMGSSTAAGEGATAGNKWSDIVGNSLTTQSASVVNIAKRGAVTYQGLSEASPRVANRPAPDPSANIDLALAHSPVVLLISYPTNDTKVGYAVDETVGNILAIRKAAFAKNIPVLVVSTQPRDLSPAEFERLHQIDAKISGIAGACFVNVHSSLAGTDGHLAAKYSAGDGIHPNDAGHRIIADAILTAIKSQPCFKLRNG